MRQTNRKTVFTLAIISLIVLSLMVFSSIPGSPISSISGPVSFITDPIQQGITSLFSTIGGFFESISDGERIRKENELLKSENAQLELRIKQLEENGRRWDELKEAFKIKEIYSGYSLIGAEILTRESGEWFDMTRINIGTLDGLATSETISYAVIDPQMNLVGRVFSSDLTSSKIMPILNEGSIVSGKLKTAGGSIVTVRGDILLKSDGACLINDIPESAVINIGDEVVTSGLGGLYPPGIPIGKIIEVMDSSAGSGKTAIMEVYTDYMNLRDVFVMKGEQIS